MYVAHAVFQTTDLCSRTPRLFSGSPSLTLSALLEILADPVGVDLKSKSNYFYEVGCKLAIHYRPISPAIADDIITAIKRCLGVRLAHAIVKRGGSVQANDPTLLQFFDSLPELEKKCTCRLTVTLSTSGPAATSRCCIRFSESFRPLIVPST